MLPHRPLHKLMHCTDTLRVGGAWEEKTVLLQNHVGAREVAFVVVLLIGCDEQRSEWQW